MESPRNNSTPRSCPCKNITWSLSSFTAAEFGDVNALSRALSKSEGSASSRRQSASEGAAAGIHAGGITPLHLAAQHGHVAATWMLLEKGHPVDGQDPNHATTKSCCTPLHRASFSGATATMRLLLETKRANLLARDTSFGDERTPLHKAAAGGRYLAVALLIDALREEGLLEDALKALDRNQETPLAVAKGCRKHQVQERQSVARWDAVAGGTAADWDKCVSLLSKAEQDTKQSDDRKQKIKPNATIKLPKHRFSRVDCLDCEANGECVTATWSAAFQKTLQQSVSFPAQSSPASEELEPLQPEPELKQEEIIDTNPAANSKEQYGLSPSKGSSSGGRACESCGVISFVLFPSASGGLVCKQCKKRRR